MKRPGSVGRREFIRLAHAGMVALPLAAAGAQAGEAAPGAAVGRSYGRKVRLGLVGCGGRGAWISGLFAAHGGFAFTSVADYFADRAARVGGPLGVSPEQCFSGLDGFLKVLPFNSLITRSSVLPRMEKARCARSQSRVSLAKGA